MELEVHHLKSRQDPELYVLTEGDDGDSQV